MSGYTFALKKIMETKTKLMLKGLSHETGTPFIVEIHSLDEVKKTGNYVVIGKNISTANGLPHLNDNTPQCFCCEGNLMVTCCYSAEEDQSNTTYGQTLIISDKESGQTNTYTRTINPAKNNGKWSSWKMMVNGEISVVAPANELYERVAQMADSLAAEVTRATDAEQQLNDSIQSLATEKADKDDYCPKLTTGFADNLVGRGESVEAQFTFRPTGGTQSVEDGVARIERIKGNTIVWNQLAQPRESTTTNGLTIESVGDGSYKLYTAEDAPTTADVFFPVTNKFIDGHKIVFYGGTATCTLKASNGVQDTGVGAIIVSAAADEVVGVFVAAGTTINTAETIFPQVFDVTKMFGTSASITSVSEFRELFPKTDNPYNAGELISFNAEAITTVGFNMFDKTTVKYGVMNYTEAVYDVKTHNKFYYVSELIRIVPGKAYYFKDIVGKAYWTAVHGLDANKKVVAWFLPDVVNLNQYNDNLYIDFSKYPNVAYVRICLHKDNLDTCCVNLAHTGYRNGDYEPYEETTRQLPIKEFFPDGMRCALKYDGTKVYDELTATQAIKRIGVVRDISKLNWSLVNDTFVSSQISGAVKNGNYLLSTLDYSTNYYKNKCYTITDSGRLYIKDSDCATVDAIKVAIAGASLNYELATPVVTDLSEPLNLDYKVSDFGTEATVTDAVSAPMKMDVVYGFNAVDSIRNNRTTIESLLARVAELESKML